VVNLIKEKPFISRKRKGKILVVYRGGKEGGRVSMCLGTFFVNLLALSARRRGEKKKKKKKELAVVGQERKKKARSSARAGKGGL